MITRNITQVNMNSHFLNKLYIEKVRKKTTATNSKIEEIKHKAGEKQN